MSSGSSPSAAARRAPTRPTSSARVNRPWTAPGVSNSVAARRAARTDAQPARSSRARMRIMLPSRSKSGRSNTTAQGNSPTCSSASTRTARSRVGVSCASSDIGTPAMTEPPMRRIPPESSSVKSWTAVPALIAPGRNASQRAAHQVPAVIGNGLEARVVQVGYERDARGIRVCSGPRRKHVAPLVQSHGEPSLFAGGHHVFGAAVFVVRNSRKPPERGERTQRIFPVGSFGQWFISRCIARVSPAAFGGVIRSPAPHPNGRHTPTPLQMVAAVLPVSSQIRCCQ